MLYSTYIGGRTGGNTSSAIAIDAAGNAYIGGSTGAMDFPTVHPVQTNLLGPLDGFVTKLGPSGQIVYSTYLGGDDEEAVFGIAADSYGQLYATGYTQSPDFIQFNAIQPTSGGFREDAFVTKFSTQPAALSIPTFLGSSGGEVGLGIAVDAAGNAYLTGITASSSFPTVNPIQPNLRGDVDAFVTKLNSTGSAIVYSTFLGGSGIEDYYWGYVPLHLIRVDEAGYAFT